MTRSHPPTGALPQSITHNSHSRRPHKQIDKQIHIRSLLQNATIHLPTRHEQPTATPAATKGRIPIVQPLDWDSPKHTPY